MYVKYFNTSISRWGSNIENNLFRYIYIYEIILINIQKFWNRRDLVISQIIPEFCCLFPFINLIIWFIDD
jgi:hypothetical protein